MDAEPVCPVCQVRLLDPEEVVVRVKQLVPVRALAKRNTVLKASGDFRYCHVVCWTQSADWIERGQGPLKSFLVSGD